MQPIDELKSYFLSDMVCQQFCFCPYKIVLFGAIYRKDHYVSVRLPSS